MPEKYNEINLKDYFYAKSDNYSRIDLELELFEKNNMIDLLKFLIYFVDVIDEKKLFVGVGRGSSVSSYLLYLIGLNMIDPIKYNLPLSDFFKELKDAWI